MIGRLVDSLVPDWRQSWRWLSVQLHFAATGILAVVVAVPTMPCELQDMVPGPVRLLLVAAWAGLGLWARLYKQKPKGGCDAEGQ